MFTQGWQRRVEFPKNTSSENLIKVNTARKKFCNTPVIDFFCEDMFYCENHTQFLIDPQFVSASVTHEVRVCRNNMDCIAKTNVKKGKDFVANVMTLLLVSGVDVSIFSLPEGYSFQ